jgi:hypothetical protein
VRVQDAVVKDDGLLDVDTVDESVARVLDVVNDVELLLDGEWAAE